jgi:large subunit ribosomal protein L15
MKLHSLKPAAGSLHKQKRLGRGEASGKGGTATKGTKGHQSRAGYHSKIGHEGGQMPLQRIIPKRGFKNINRTEHKIFNLAQIELLVAKYKLADFSEETLLVNNLISRTDKVKILGNGEIATKLHFKVHAVSAKAKTAIEAAGGTVEILK